jgi:hypothetical protein
MGMMKTLFLFDIEVLAALHSVAFCSTALALGG